MKLRRTLPYVLFITAAFAITKGAERGGGLAGLSFRHGLEITLLLYLYSWSRELCSGLSRKAELLLSWLPVLATLFAFDFCFARFGRVVRVQDVALVYELGVLYPRLATLLFLAVSGTIALLAILRIRRRRFLRLALTSAPLVLCLGVICLRPAWFLIFFEHAAHDVVVWSDANSVENNGRLTMLLYQEAVRRETVRQLATAFDDDEDYERRFHETREALLPAQRRNVHVLVLEGFFDPSLMTGVTFNQDPFHPRFRSLLNGRSDYLSISPVFGGTSAQAEFEVLCGVEALHRFGPVEFNLFTGSSTHCLPDVLRSLGYVTIATNSFKPNFFNADVAYRSIGFDEVYFPREHAPRRDTYLSAGDTRSEYYMFDGDLLTQNLQFLATTYAARSATPVLNYIIGVYGHHPYSLNKNTRPVVIEPRGAQELDELYTRLVNQIYYRTQALAEFVEKIQSVDPTSIIVMVGDHLPTFQDGTAAYVRHGYLTDRPDAIHQSTLIIFDRGVPVSVGVGHHYDIPAIIYGLLVHGTYTADVNSNPLATAHSERAYYQIIAHGTQGLWRDGGFGRRLR